jgi:heme-degrading monooxygenase HmoA
MSYMIMRYWRGWATRENADAYQRIVSTTVLPHIASLGLSGYHGAYLMRREVGDEVEFATITMFDSLDDVRAFAGDDYEQAYVPAEARAVLTRFDERCAHYDTVLTPRQTS